MSDVNDDLPPDWNNYPDGSILRIHFHNFLTYEDTVCKPGENLNLIIGHNGSGKSSIICGLCLVFGGSPKSLGRSEKISDYIRHGCNEGFVEVTIANKKDKPQTIRLSLRIGSSPEYKLNGNASTQSSIKELCLKFNIQIDNPCAFLAQDKVKSFSEQSPVELLFNTEKAASSELVENHKNLIEERKSSSQLENKCSTAINSVRQIEEDISKLEPRVENYRKKKQMQTKLRLLEQNMAIIEFKHCEDVYNKNLKEADKVQANCEKLKEKVEKAKLSIPKFKSQSNNIRQKIEETNKKCRELRFKISEMLDKDYISNKVNEAKMKLDNEKSLFEKSEKYKQDLNNRIKHLEKKIEEMEAELGDYDDFFKKYRIKEEKLYDEEKDLRVYEDKLVTKMYNIRSLREKKEAKEREFQNVSENRLKQMSFISRDAVQAWKFYQQNRNLFKDEVYVPIMHLIMKTDESAKTVENLIGRRDWCMFVCSCEEDEKLLHNSNKEICINTTVVSKKSVHETVINAKLPNELRQFGFSFFVSECLDAPDSLKQYLCNVYQINRIPVGGNQIERNLGKVSEKMAEMRYFLFLSQHIRVKISVSKYSGEVIQSQQQMRNAGFWTESCFKKSIVQENLSTEIFDKQIQEAKLEVSKSQSELKMRKEQIQKERDIIKNEFSVRKSRKHQETLAKNDLKTVQEKLAKVEAEKIDIEKAELEYEQAKADVREGAKKMLSDCIDLQEKLIGYHQEIGQYLIFEKICAKKASNEEEMLKKIEIKLENAEVNKVLVEDELRISLNKKTAAKENLNEKCKLKTLNIESMDSVEKLIWEKIIEMFNEENIPNDKEELVQQINAENMKLKLAEGSSEDGNIEDERKMEKLKEFLIEESTKRDVLQAKKLTVHESLQESINEWKEKVLKMIVKINESYRESFKKLGCLGEVHLEEPENPLDIEAYGIMIMVSFRKGEQLKRLDQRVQSGGERSVSTMLYLLALQQLCPVPFRCVDEINQGMDPTNERKVFEIMVNLWSENGALAKTQYFLLTPKLLHNLPMNERVTVLCVHTAVAKDFTNWNTPRYVEGTLGRVEAC